MFNMGLFFAYIIAITKGRLKKTAYFRTSGKKEGGPKTKTKKQKKNEFGQGPRGGR